MPGEFRNHTLFKLYSNIFIRGQCEYANTKFPDANRLSFETCHETISYFDIEITMKQIDKDSLNNITFLDFDTQNIYRLRISRGQVSKFSRFVFGNFVLAYSL